MTFEVRITQAAWADAEEIYGWIRARGAPLSAHRWFNAWLRRVQNLETFPAGRSLAPENGEVPGVEIHQQIFGTFRTLYVVRDQQVLLIHVRRGSRQSATLNELRAGVEEALTPSDADPSKNPPPPTLD